MSSPSFQKPTAAKPAQKNSRKNAQRLFIPTPLSEGAIIPLSADHAHYLTRVLRLDVGAEVLVFNGQDGEYLTQIADMSKRAVMLEIKAQTRPQDNVPPLTLYFAPPKGERTDYIVEKATEMGAARIVPVLTERTQNRHLKIEKLTARAIEAAEQTGRLSVPEIMPPVVIEAIIAPKDSAREQIKIFVADEIAAEGADVPPLASALSTTPQPKEPIGLFVGPEGGFSPAERAAMASAQHLYPVGLGPRILRADSACYAAMVIAQTVWGDWR